MQATSIPGVRAAGLIMTGVMLAEAWPLAMIGIQPQGPASLGRMLGWAAPPSSPLAWLMAAAVAAGYAALSMTSLPFIRTHALDMAPIKLLAVPFALVTGTFEELFFRKWLMDLLAGHAVGATIQVITSGVLFGFVHAFWGVLGGNLVAAGKAILFTSGLGVALGIVYLASARQLAPAAWAHVAINLVIEPWLMLAVMDLRRRPAAA